MLKITLKQLEAFVATAENSSFTKAAEQLYLSQSTVSCHVQDLEQILGMQLLQRDSKKKSTLTAQGKQAYTAALEILSRCQELEQVSAGNGQQEELSLGASTVPAQYLLPTLMSTFLRQHPGCRYLLQRADSSRIHQLLKTNQIRLGFVGAQLDPRGCNYLPLLRDKLVVITENNEHFRDLRRRGVLGKQLLEQPMIAREESSGTQQSLHAYLQKIGLSPQDLRIIARMDNPQSIINWVQQGLGIAVISSLAIAKEAALGKLLTFELDEEGIYRDLYLVWLKESHLSRVETKFIAHIRATVAECKPSVP